MDPLLGGVILQLVAAFMGAALYIFKNFRTMAGATADTVSAPISLMMNGILWSVAAGLSVGMAEILSFVISGMNVKASQSIPTIIGGSVVIGTVLGSVWLREKLTLRGWFGVLLITIGIAIIGIDPGTTTAH
jgi:transporter family protein